MKHNIGDKVLVISGTYKNQQGTIVKISHINSNYFYVTLDVPRRKRLFHFSELELINTDQTTNNAGTKHDNGKVRMSLIPTDALIGAANGLTYGERKYGTHNFRNGIEYSRLADATLRHLSAWLEGENLDLESGNSHLDHALATLCMLKFMEVNKPNMDDRWMNPKFKQEDKSDK